MAKLTKQEYDELMEMPKEYLTQEDLNDIHEYESSEAGAPSNEDLQWARDILNEKDPQIQAAFRKSGDLDKAMSIMNQKRIADELMISRDQDPYVKKVKSTPEDIIKKGGFKFNWRDAYEQNKGEKLRATEADAKKLQDFINSNMYNVDDDIKLKQIAYNLHMFNPNTMKWSEFINSEQGEEFKKYLEDVRKAQTEKAVNDIWEGKEPSQQWTPFGYKEVPGSMKVVDFMLPVSKEYAKKHFNDEDFSIAGPLATDAAANIVMNGTGALPATKVMNKPLVSFLYGNVAAPFITETGNAVFNKESIPEAFVRTAEGTLINVGTPRILEGMLSSAGRGLPTIEGKRKVQKMIDEAANKAAKVIDDVSNGKPINIHGQPGPIEFAQYTKDGIKFYSSDIPTSQKRSPSIKFESINDMPVESLTQDEYTQFLQGMPFLRGKYGDNVLSNKLKEIQDLGSEQMRDVLLLKKAQSLSKNGNLSSLTPAEIRQLGFTDKESYMNWLIRTVKHYTPSTLQTYLTNAAGRPEFGREAGPVEALNRIFGTNFFMNKSKEDKQKSRIERILGIE